MHWLMYHMEEANEDLETIILASMDTWWRAHLLALSCILATRLSQCEDTASVVPKYAPKYLSVSFAFIHLSSGMADQSAGLNALAPPSPTPTHLDQLSLAPEASQYKSSAFLNSTGTGVFMYDFWIF